MATSISAGTPVGTGTAPDPNSRGGGMAGRPECAVVQGTRDRGCTVSAPCR